MIKLKFFIATLLSLALVIMTMPIYSFAVDDPCENVSGSTYCDTVKSTGNPLFGPDGLATNITQLITVIAGVVSIVVIILGGIKYITSTGDPQKINSAKNTILYACIGLVVSLLSQAVVSFILRNI